MANKPLEFSVRDLIPLATFRKCEKLTSGLTADFCEWFSGYCGSA